MHISIEITDKDTVDGMKAVGAKDLLEHFLPKIFINADSVRVTELTDEEMEKRCSGKPYRSYTDEFRKDDS
jgi:hypothetical protein